MLSPPPPADVAGESVDFPSLTKQLGGWSLNDWRAPEPSRGTALRALGKGNSWGRVWDWLNTPAQERTIEPDSTERLLDRLTALSNGSREDVRNALDIKPDFAPALSQYWLQAALVVAEQDFLQPVKNRSASEQLQRKMEWENFINEARANILNTNPRALRLADFLTQNACAKQPKSAAVWRARVTFLRLTDRTEEAGIALNQAVTLAPDDIEVLKQAALWHAERNEFVESLDLLRRACVSVHNAEASSLESICSLGLLSIEMTARYRGFNGLEEHAQWILSEVERHIGRHPGKDVDDEEAGQLSNLSGKLTELLCRFRDGPPVALAANLRLARLLGEDKRSSRQQLYQSSILSIAAWSALLSGDIDTAVMLGRKSVQVGNDNFQVWINLAHALLASGKVSDAMRIYTTMLKQDDDYSGLISQSIYQDIFLLKNRGVPVSGTDALCRQLKEKLVAKFNNGVAVINVLGDSQAAKLGIKVGDRIIRYDNEPILDINEFGWDRRIEQFEAVDASRMMTLVRDGQKRELQVRAGLLGIGMAR